jgi:hypothetical protein
VKPLGEGSQVDDDRADAADVLPDVLDWELTPRRWQMVERAVGELAETLTSQDREGIRRAVADLELAGPVRAVSARTIPGGTQEEKERAPAQLRERINELIHDLQPPTAERPSDDASGAAG